ncbi:electron transport complex protein RnfC, partial [bacterium]|nr:electron transport complex protein RnfC [candidate division CSSED10-310 bacterium]
MDIQKVKDLGIVGAGGGGFPTHIKLDSQPEIFILNGVECEPLLHKDKELLIHHTDLVLKGLEKAMELTGAKQGLICIKAKYQNLIDSVARKMPSHVRIEPVGDFYPAGDEITLIYLTTGRIVQPGQIPISVGCVVQN